MSAPRSALDLAASKPGLALRAIEFAGAVTNLVRRLRNRNAMLALADLSESQLLDIGLTREDVHSAVTSSFFANTGSHLTRAARLRANAYYQGLRQP
ncbi:protein of unknown function [Rhizobium sp. RU20A]|uniref:DUF1127 domain-containing protein n=1 Tax=Rhizobium sp. RU20A TaxID=1907412 RepID=UPI000956B251|nr:DUF1127 domain-containing protein [Rhizobium sp. RU20A]SIR05747.1 protein of unknown function [Rhizobium sp. RU20A]